MHLQSKPGRVAGKAFTDLVLARLPNGAGVAWLRPCTEPAEPDDALYVITDRGRRALRMAELIGSSPTDAQVRRATACQP